MTRIFFARSIAVFLCAAITGTALPDKPVENGIRVHIEGLNSDQGQVVCALFASADAFPKRIDRAYARMAVPIVAGHANCEFTMGPAGTYAVSVFHDENSNGKLDTNWLGIPREGVGASNNPKPRMGPPKFRAAKFQYSEGSIDIDITIHYI